MPGKIPDGLHHLRRQLSRHACKPHNDTTTPTVFDSPACCKNKQNPKVLDTGSDKGPVSKFMKSSFKSGVIDLHAWAHRG